MAAVSFAVSAPMISLPKGGEAIRGLGEKFAANRVTGTGSMSVPIASRPGRSGFGPRLSLAYDSGSGNGPFGFGWSLSVPAIVASPTKACRNTATAKRPTSSFHQQHSERGAKCLRPNAPPTSRPTRRFFRTRATCLTCIRR